MKEHLNDGSISAKLDHVVERQKALQGTLSDLSCIKCQANQIKLHWIITWRLQKVIQRHSCLILPKVYRHFH
ncbi:hypothetical protein C4D60_Mb04t40130 [Musa balbisiana]|uniref:Uncharacterized protein n=1 Tax=Musa balbisiana TaxID=52838 RepID=A0A4S8KI59_MUSBA|nr:hypothetical protein C4D60_Mb04t40130 [Musa balbisiana]